MVKTQNSEKKKQHSLVRSHNFQKLYGTNLAGGGTEYDFRFELFNEKIKLGSSKEWSYISDALIILTPRAAKKLHSILGAYIKSYEKDHGSLSDPDPIEVDEGKSE
ncbi:MAG: DUF3467 domain-containing protein [Cuniculiplasma sp.]